MKMLKKLTTLLLGVAFLCALVLTPAKVSRADGPVTWYLNYSGGEWFGSNNQIDYWTLADFVRSNMKDGDNIVFNGDGSKTEIFKYSVDKKVGDVAVTNGATVSLEAPYVERAYVAGKGGTLIVTAPTVHYVTVAPAQTVQVMGNVIDLVAKYDYGEEYPVFGVTGTVTAASVGYNGDMGNATHRIYGIGAGLMQSDNTGNVILKEGQYSLTLTEPPTSGTTQKSADSAQAGKQLDKVPQTGSEVSMETYIFGGLALLFAAAAVMIGFTSKKNG